MALSGGTELFTATQEGAAPFDRSACGAPSTAALTSDTLVVRDAAPIRPTSPTRPWRVASMCPTCRHGDRSLTEMPGPRADADVLDVLDVPDVPDVPAETAVHPRVHRTARVRGAQAAPSPTPFRSRRPLVRCGHPSPVPGLHGQQVRRPMVHARRFPLLGLFHGGDLLLDGDRGSVARAAQARPARRAGASRRPPACVFAGAHSTGLPRGLQRRRLRDRAKSRGASSRPRLAASTRPGLSASTDRRAEVVDVVDFEVGSHCQRGAFHYRGNVYPVAPAGGAPRSTSTS